MADNFGLDHTVGHPIPTHFRRRVFIYQTDKGAEGTGRHPEWPKVADAVIKAPDALNFVKQVRLYVPHNGLTVSRIEQPGRGDQAAQQ